ncbi:hypothetical protein E1211_00755 [Micromonospora sp. 15K316]|uniref:hypothetical protein n=1 Tax=Micromonospora sp. 15K316 TaxID=2530376 RepID=UPI00104EA37F|nr:hypothetical protein [Micromonospora sp. 15K316]TDC40669.1 hypothetical protein E1211_00755 [Micromonospora sp. 15K316]
MTEEMQNRALTAALADAAAIRSTIERKANHNQNVIGLHLTVVAAVAGFILAERADLRLLLLLPLLSAALGLNVVSQYRDIRIAGEYIEQVLSPAIARYTGNATIFGWESSYWKRKRDGHVAQALAMGLIFPGVSTVALAVTLPAVRNPADLLAWSLGAGLLLLLLAAWSYRLREMVRARRGLPPRERPAAADPAARPRQPDPAAPAGHR